MSSSTQYSKLNVFLIKCIKLDERQAVVVFATQFPDVWSSPIYRYRTAAVEKVDGVWKYTSVIISGANDWLPECATRCNEPIDNCLGMDVMEAVSIATQLELL